MERTYIEGRAPKILLDANILRAFNIVAKNYYVEFTMILHCRQIGNEYHLFDYYFPIQKNSSTQSSYDGVAMLDTLEDEGADLGLINGHLHSHHNMPVNPSYTDISEIAARGKNSGINVAVICNNVNKLYGHIYDYNNGVYYKDVPVEISYDFDETAFDKYVFDMVKGAKSLNKVKEILGKDHRNDFFIQNCETSVEDLTVELKKQIKTKFSNGVSSGHYVGKAKKYLYGKNVVEEEEDDAFKRWLGNVKH